MKVGDPIKLVIYNQEHSHSLAMRFGMGVNLIKGNIESKQGPAGGRFYLVKLDGVKIHGDVIYGFFETEIELDLQTLREKTLNELNII